MSLPTKHLYEFGPFVLDAAERVLLREGKPVALTTKSFDTLFALIENSGRIVGKDELMSRVWPDSFVEESNLAFNISVLRKTLAEGANEIQFIETVPKRGYRFVANVRESVDQTPEVLLERQTISRVVIEEQREEMDVADNSGVTGRPRSLLYRRLISSWKTPAACALVVVIAAAAVYFRVSSSPAAKTIAVLPFKPLSANASDEYLELGMADALITRLSNLREVIVRPTSSVLKYTAAGADAIAAGRELGVDTVLDGSVQRSGDTIRVTVRLVRVSDGVPLWAEKFDESFTNIFAVQDSISERMTRALTLNLTGDEKTRLTKRHTASTEAYQAYLKGRYHWSKWNGQGLKKATEYFQQALEKDPRYALAYSGLADAYNLLGYLNISPPGEMFPKSEEAARKALELDDQLSEAHLSLAKVKLFYDWDRSGFESELKRALDLDPNYADAHGMYGTYLTAIGKFDQALAERKRAQELDPLSPLFTVSVGWVYFYARSYDQAIEWYKKALDLDPNFAQAHNDLAITYSVKGMHAESVDESLKAGALSGATPETIAALRQAFEASGIKGYWEKELESAQRGQPNPHRMARIYAELGDKDRAFEWLDKAYEERLSLLTFIKVNPLFDTLHSDPRFADLLRRIGLE